MIITIDSPIPVQNKEELHHSISLPLELFWKVLPYLDEKSAQSAVRVCRFWQVEVISLSKQRMLKKLKELMDVLIDVAEKRTRSSYCLSQFTYIKENCEVLNATNLKMIKSSFTRTIEKLISVFLCVKDESIKIFEERFKIEKTHPLFQKILEGRNKNLHILSGQKCTFRQFD